MAKYFDVHPADPQPRLITQVVHLIRDGQLVVYPTDSCYAFGCRLGSRTALERIRTVRNLDDRHHFTLVCRDFSQLGQFVQINNAVFRLVKAATPGSYTFILPARRQVPRRVTSRKTIGVRIPGHPAAHALLSELDAPMLSATATLAGEATPLADAQEIRARLEHALELIVDGGPCGTEPSTVIDLTKAEPQVLRAGKGSLAPFSVESV